MIDRGKTLTTAGALLACLSLVLTGCFISPGKFEAEMLLLEEDRFAFTYDGEIHFLGLSNLAEMEAAAERFEPEPCYEEGTFDERDCTEAELAEQRADWEAEAEERAAEAARDAEQVAAMMGGIDPSDPEASAELAALLLRQKGWERVEPLGDGVFDVRYAVSGRLSHDFLFPMIEGFPITSPFVQIYLREDDVVRIDAPGFSPQNESNPMGGLMGGMAGMAGMAAREMGGETETDMPPMPVIEGTFTIVTTGEIRANNTDEGPRNTARGQELEWDILPRTKNAPTALIDLSR